MIDSLSAADVLPSTCAALMPIFLETGDNIKRIINSASIMYDLPFHAVPDKSVNDISPKTLVAPRLHLLP